MGTGFSTSTTLMTGCGSWTPQRLQFGLVAHCTSSQSDATNSATRLDFFYS